MVRPIAIIDRANHRLVRAASHDDRSRQPLTRHSMERRTLPPSSGSAGNACSEANSVFASASAPANGTNGSAPGTFANVTVAAENPSATTTLASGPATAMR